MLTALIERVVRAVKGAAARLSFPALLVTHGGAIRTLLAALPAARGALATGARLPIANGAVVRVSLAAGEPVAVTRLEF